MRFARGCCMMGYWSVALSRDLKGRGFTFVGPTICYAFMQSAGLVDDHLASCFRAGPAN